MVTDAEILEEVMEHEGKGTSSLQVGQVLEAVEGVPTQRIVTVENADHIAVWDTKTGEESWILGYRLKEQLKKTHEDGTRAFTTHKPDFEPKRGTVRCLLHPGDPNRARYDGMGLPTCGKSNLVSQYQLERHMRGCHHDEWEAIEKERVDTEKAEDRATQRAMMEAIAGRKALDVLDDNTIPVIAEAIVSGVEEKLDAEVETVVAELVCPTCGKQCKNKLGFHSHTKSHKRGVKS